jgi:UDP-galactopyranose mutase
MKFAVVGAGFSGAVLSYQLAKSGHEVDLFESRNHLGGNCFTERDSETDILVHKYGPHIFHTNNKHVWDFVNQFSEFIPYINRVKTTSGGKVYSLPINLHTINQFFGLNLNPLAATKFISGLSDQTISEPISFEEQALKFIGRELYETFFKGYTLKQWGVNPSNLPASILKRLPIRFNYDDNYFSHKYQGMPKNGYTPIFEKMLDSKSINIYLSSKFNKNQISNYSHTFYSGPLDAWFNYSLGHLSYRTLDFKREIYEGDYQGCAVMNYGDLDIPYTRISEHKHFSTWEQHQRTVIFKEYSRSCGPLDEPYYPVRLLKDKELLNKYVVLAKNEKDVSFLGRLGTYRYLDMDVTIAEALRAGEQAIDFATSFTSIPPFFIDDL